MPLTETEVINFIKANLQPNLWVQEARGQHVLLDALVTGKDFSKILIERIEKIESSSRAIARQKYSKDIRDVVNRVYQPRHNIFTASGGSVHIDIALKTNKEKLVKTLKEFKGQKSLKKYLSENFFRLEDTDPNGIIFLEYVKDEKIYPTYKSINDIRTYKSNGQLLDLLLFEPKTKIFNNLTYTEWRLVDEKNDWRISQVGDNFTVIEDKTFPHPFGTIPAVILSDIQEMGVETRLSPIEPILELLKEYARDKSIKTIYKFLHGFPRHWRYIKECRPCQGTGKTGEKSCEKCNGTGEIRSNDITDVQTIALPREDDKIVTPNIEGFVTPDLQTWNQFIQELTNMEELIESTVWGTHRSAEGGNETATGRFIDVQPVMNKLGWFTDNVEWVHNKLAEWTVNWVENSVNEKSNYNYTYGRRFIIESPDVILEKYSLAREKGVNSTVLDKLLDEYILSKYQSDPIMLEQMQKKRLVEPFVHNSTQEISDMFGPEKAYTKTLFIQFWQEVEKTKTVDILKKEFDKYITDNQVEFKFEVKHNFNNQIN